MICNRSLVLASIVGAASRVHRVVRERKYANDRQGAMGGIPMGIHGVCVPTWRTLHRKRR